MTEINTENRDYVLLKLEEHPSPFLEHFLKACLAADSQNWDIIAPALARVMVKYPLKKQILQETHGQSNE